jgi:hypothetical protein
MECTLAQDAALQTFTGSPHVLYLAVCCAACAPHQALFLPLAVDAGASCLCLVQAGHPVQHTQQDELPGHVVRHK